MYAFRAKVASVSAVLIAACLSGEEPAPSSDGIGFYVSTLGPILVTASPVPAENGVVQGNVRVFVDRGDPPAGTVVNLNGVTLPVDPNDARFFRVTGSGVPAVAPGGRLTLTASVGGRHASFSFDCPPAISAVNAAPDPIVRGSSVAFHWAGEAFHNPPTSIAPGPRLTFCDHQSPSTGYPNSCGARTDLVYPSTTVTATAPTLSGDLGFLVEFQLPGRLVQIVLPDGQIHQGICELRQRVPFAATGP